MSGELLTDFSDFVVWLWPAIWAPALGFGVALAVVLMVLEPFRALLRRGGESAT